MSSPVVLVHLFFSIWWEIMWKLFADEYFLSRLPIVNLRLAQGGVRLAAILNHYFVKWLHISSMLYEI